MALAVQRSPCLVNGTTLPFRVATTVTAAWASALAESSAAGSARSIPTGTVTTGVPGLAGSSGSVLSLRSARLERSSLSVSMDVLNSLFLKRISADDASAAILISFVACASCKTTPLKFSDQLTMTSTLVLLGTIVLPTHSPAALRLSGTEVPSTNISNTKASAEIRDWISATGGENAICVAPVSSVVREPLLALLQATNDAPSRTTSNSRHTFTKYLDAFIMTA